MCVFLVLNYHIKFIRLCGFNVVQILISYVVDQRIRIRNVHFPVLMQTIIIYTAGSKIMPVVENTTHMGILRSSSNQKLNAVEHNIQKAHRKAYGLMGAGLHVKNGHDPESSISLLNTYVFPVLFHGLEVIIPNGKNMNTLDKQYKQTHKTCSIRLIQLYTYYLVLSQLKLLYINVHYHHLVI